MNAVVKKKAAPAQKSETPRAATKPATFLSHGFTSVTQVDRLAKELSERAEIHRRRFGGWIPDGLTAEHRAFAKPSSRIAYRRRQRRAKRGAK